MKNSTIPRRRGIIHFLISLLLLIVCYGSSPMMVQALQDSSKSLTFLVQEETDGNNAQAPLEKLISIDFENVTLKKALKIVARKAKLKLVYSPKLVPYRKRVSLHKRKIKVEKALWSLLAHTGLGFAISSKNHLVLIKLPVNKKTEQAVQTGSITGTVVDAKTGKPMPGASVFLEGTTTGASTDEDGKYTISEVGPGSYTLIARFIGYKEEKKEISVAADETITVNFELVPEETKLPELLVTGYQTLPSQRASGAFGYIGEDEIVNSRSVDVASALAGKVAGLRVLTRNGDTEFTIRGLGTMTSSVNDPLIVVDGFPIEGGLSTVNPNNIKSIHVLKDAAAASIWGARASNGVIVIETKNAKDRKGLHVAVNVFTSIQEEIDLDQANPIANSATALEWERYLWENYGGLTLSYKVDGNNNDVSYGISLLNLLEKERISQAEFEQRWNELKKTDYKSDVYKYLLRRPITQNYNIAISGGSERNSFILSVRYIDHEDGFRYSDNRELLANFRNNYEIASWLDSYVSITTRFVRSNNSGTSLGEISSTSPYEELVDENGDYTQMVGDHYQVFIDSTGKYFPVDWNYNLLQDVRSRNLESQENDIRAQVGLTFDILEGLVYQTEFQYELYKSSTHNYYSEDSYYVRDQINKYVKYDEQTNEVLKTYVPLGGQLIQNFGTTSGYALRNQINYKQAFKDNNHIISAGLTTEITSNVFEYYKPPTIYGYDPDKLTSVTPDIHFPIESYWGYPTYTLSGMESLQTYSNDRFFSLLGNIAYTYRNKYTLTGSYRVDASNLIVKENFKRYSPFWSVGANWQLGEEDFMKSITVIDRLNVRLSYGYSGNVVLSTSPVPLISYQNPYPLTNAEYATITNFGNPNLRWERTAIINFGVDYSLFNGKLYGVINVYNKHGKDIIGAVDLPRITGTSSESFNTAEIINRGFELNINTSLTLASRVLWNSSLNFSYNKSEVLSLEKVRYNDRTIREPHFETGKPVNTIYSYIYLGVNADGIPYLRGVGNNTFTFNEFAPRTVDDRLYMGYAGTTQPTSIVGFENSIHAFGFRISALITGAFRHVFRRPTFDYHQLSQSKSTSTLHRDAESVLNGTAEGIPPMPPVDSNLRHWGVFLDHLNSTIEDADNIRLRRVNLSYTLPIDITTQLGLRKAEIYFQIRNVGLLWAANDEGLDPLYTFGGFTNTKPGRLYKLGVSFEF